MSGSGQSLESLQRKELEDLRKDLIDNYVKPNQNKGLDVFAKDLNPEFKQKICKFAILDEFLSKPRVGGNVEDNEYRSVQQLLKRRHLVEQMVMGGGDDGGAADGNYGKAYQIYQEIEQTSEHKPPKLDNAHPILNRLAVAISLVHAAPVEQTNPKKKKMKTSSEDVDAETVVDPVKRYLNYESAYLDGLLDPNFSKLHIWELTYVVDGDEPDEIASWGRSTLRNYFPDHVLSSLNDGGNKFLYAGIVRTDIPYGSSRVCQDLDYNHKYQNILMNGGICGRRAFFGRFILRSFGIPTTARPSKGHAALVHYMPGGADWEVNLGGNWGAGYTKTRFVKDLDFLNMTKARRSMPYEFSKVRIARLIGDVMKEKHKVYGIYDPKAKGRGQCVKINLEDRNIVGYWYGRALKAQQNNILNRLEKNPALMKRNFAAYTGPSPDRIPVTLAEKLQKEKPIVGKPTVVKSDGTIRIPAASYKDPKKVKDVKIMKSFRTDSITGGDNHQIYLPSFSPEGTTIMRGGTWKDVRAGHCNSGSRLPSDGKGHYEDWGFRVAMTLDSDNEDEDGWEKVPESSCPEPTLTFALSSEDGSKDPAAVTITFVYVPPGTFVMGGSRTEDGRFKCVEVPHHKVRITKGFYMGKYPVTQQQYQQLIGKNPSKSTKQPMCPVDNVDVNNALLFCEKASAVTGCDIRLPTEAEWEYASRGTTNGTAANPKWFFGNDASKLTEYAWIKPNSDGKSHPVGQLKPNPFGLHDVYGNVCERVADTYKRSYYEECHNQDGGCCNDPKGPSQGVKSKFEYNNVPISQGGNYTLTATVCTITDNQKLTASLSPYDDDASNNDPSTFVMDLPYTRGEWQDVTCDKYMFRDLNPGNMSLHFWRESPPQYGLSIKSFTLTKLG